MVRGMKKEKLKKRTNRKQNFKAFVDSGFTDVQALIKACKNDENLLIYTCLTKDELIPYIEEIKKLNSVDAQIKYLVDNQPYMNETEERYNKAVDTVAMYLKGYIEYNGFRMANADGNNEDWTSEFWAKFCKICDFYRTRWFHPEKLLKPSTVKYQKILYKEFIYIVRMSITGERKHVAFLATQNHNSSLFKLSLDGTLDVDDEEKTLADVVEDDEHSSEALLENTNMERIIAKALEIARSYPDALECINKIEDFYDKQDPIGFDKKTIILGKIFLYKAGLVSPKVLAFIKALSPTYKNRYNISQHRVLAQIKEYKAENPTIPPYVKKKSSDLGWRDLILKKRGEI